MSLPGIDFVNKPNYSLTSICTDSVLITVSQSQSTHRPPTSLVCDVKTRKIKSPSKVYDLSSHYPSVYNFVLGLLLFLKRSRTFYYVPWTEIEI